MRTWVPQSFVAKHFGLSTRTVRDWAKKHDLTVWRYRGYVFYDLNEFDEVVKKMEENWVK